MSPDKKSLEVDSNGMTDQYYLIATGKVPDRGNKSDALADVFELKGESEETLWDLATNNDLEIDQVVPILEHPLCSDRIYRAFFVGNWMGLEGDDGDDGWDEVIEFYDQVSELEFDWNPNKFLFSFAARRAIECADLSPETTEWIVVQYVEDFGIPYIGMEGIDESDWLPPTDRWMWLQPFLGIQNKHVTSNSALEGLLSIAEARYEAIANYGRAKGLWSDEEGGHPQRWRSAVEAIRDHANAAAETRDRAAAWLAEH